jgi:nitronate monooxygenase
MNVKELKSRLKLPVVSAPMFLVSGTKLVIEACKAGVLGTFPALNARTTEEFENWLIEIKGELGEDALYGVNLIVHRSNPRLEADLAICVKHKVPVIITSLGAVSELVDTVHSYGGLVFHDVTNKRHGKKAAGAGVDGLIAVSAGAGGHAGTLNPFALIDELKSFYQGAILLAGSLSHGAHVLAAEVMGADFAYMGTRFINTVESSAQDRYKEMVKEAGASDIIHTPAVSGVPANFMRQSLEEAGFDIDKLNEKGEVDFGDKLTLDNEAKAWKNIWSAGHGVSCINDIPTTEELVSRLNSEYQTAKKSIS